MGRKKPTKTRGTTKKNSAASGRSKTKSAAVTKKIQPASEKTLINRLRRLRRDEERRAREREYKRRQRATMDVTELLRVRARDASRKREYRSNLTIEKLMQIRELDKQRKRIERAERGNITEEDLVALKSMDKDDKDQEEKIADELLVALRPKIEADGIDEPPTTTAIIKSGRRIKKSVKFT